MLGQGVMSQRADVALVREPLRSRLERERGHLKSRLVDIDNALRLLDENPTVEDVLEAVQKVAGL